MCEVVIEADEERKEKKKGTQETGGRVCKCDRRRSRENDVIRQLKIYEHW